MAQTFDPSCLLKEALHELGCRGALLAVSDKGSLRTFAAGLVKVSDHGRAYYIYSISKTFTAVATMALCEEQGDFLDERFSTLVPGKRIPDDITIRQLLNHTSGLSDYFSAPEYQRAVRANPSEPWPYEVLMEVGLRETPLFKAGRGWRYSNPGYALVKELIEEISGLSFYDYVERVIIKRIGLEDTRPFLTVDDPPSLLEADDDSFADDFRTCYHPGWIATGCFISTASDVARFFDALFGGRLVNKESLGEMVNTVDVVAPDSPDSSIPSYGLGLMHARNSPLGQGYGHGGGGPGYTTYALHYPNLKGRQVSISLVLNRSLPQTPFKLADEIVGHYLESG